MFPTCLVENIRFDFRFGCEASCPCLFLCGPAFVYLVEQARSRERAANTAQPRVAVPPKARQAGLKSGPTQSRRGTRRGEKALEGESERWRPEGTPLRLRARCIAPHNSASQE